jgi:hypothetical protein
MLTIVAVILVANVYILIATHVGARVFDDMSDRWCALLSLFWPITYPLVMFGSIMANIVWR